MKTATFNEPRLVVHTDRRKAILSMTADGNTVDQIADIVGLPYEDVRRELDGLRRLNKARNVAHLVAIALRSGYIK